MTICLKERFGYFLNNRWLVFVAAMWIQICAGIVYLFGSISPVIKISLNYNQKQIARLIVAKDLGYSLGFLAATLCEIFPLWAALLVGAIQNFIGYGWIWLVVTRRTAPLPLWAMCILIFVGTNGETYFNTATLVSCVGNFPKSRGPVVGILKGFAGLGGAILTQIYAVIHSPDHASLIFMIAVAPAMVIIALMFIIRPVGGHRQVRPSDGLSFSFVYSICLLLASYLMGVMLVEDFIDVSQNVIIIFTAILFVILIIPIVIPIYLSFTQEPRVVQEEEALLSQSGDQGPGRSEHGDGQEIIFSEAEEEKPKGVDLLPALEKQKRIAQLKVRLAEGAVRINRRRGPCMGEDFTLVQALIKADFWLMFFSLLFGSGSSLTVIDNLGQMSQSFGYDNTHVFVSMISIWNFLGRIGSGYFSEIIVRDNAYPRHAALAIAQVVMAFGHFFFAMGWPGAMYIGTLLVGLGHGTHWAVVPAAASELFGLKNFGCVYNFLTISTPVGSLVFSGLIASSIYDMEAEKQAQQPRERRLMASVLTRFLNMDEPLKCEGTICFFLTSLIMSGICIIAAVLSMILVYRTKTVYANLYGRSRM
ncbi:protein NUCLEAR FUSION DEFECTIVE 4-like [Solanum stenotomum]|uniref:protein NUCLEAR FUSION DEFECTIVE 4-like n=1 Tax=Solanum stenotomum TaxID=172797 RepID=UPI0020D1CB46|nr:protein NUCLEAR FUSION DEFECTIVE 4-like [Solanum stenotomum]